MSLVSLGGMPLLMLGIAGRQGAVTFPSLSSAVLDAVNEALIGYGQLYWADGGTHTVDTTGSSSIGYRITSGSGYVMADAGTTIKVGIAAVDTTAAIPARAVNVADVITFDVFRSSAGNSGDFATSTWNRFVPTSGTKTIVHGDLIAIAVQMTARGGVDVFNAQYCSAEYTPASPAVTTFVGGAYSAPGALPNFEVIASDGTKGWFFGTCLVTDSLPTITWSNASSPSEYANYINLPFPVRVHGLILGSGTTGDWDATLYSDPLGTPVLERSYSVDANTVADSTGNRYLPLLLSSPYDVKANTPIAVGMKPTTATTVNAMYVDQESGLSIDQAAYTLGNNCYAITRSGGTGAFAAFSSQTRRFNFGVLVSHLDFGGPRNQINGGLVQ